MKSIEKIKRAMLLFVAAATLHSCNQAENNLCFDQGDPITIITQSASSKGTPIEDTSYPSVKIWALETSDGSLVVSEDIAGEKLVESTADFGTGAKSWGFSSTKYWGSRTSLDFYAISPAMDIDFSDTANPTISYTPATDISSQSDLLLATTTTSSGQSVELNFSHLLTRLDFDACLADEHGFSSNESVTVTSITLDGFAESGTYYCTTGTWESSTTTTSYYLTSGDEISTEEITTTSSSVLAEDGYAMLIPYSTTIPDDAKVTIIYTIANQSTNATAQETVEINLSEKLTALEEGNAYKFNIEISKIFVKVDILSKSLDEISEDLEWTDQYVDTDLNVGSYFYTGCSYVYFNYTDSESDDDEILQIVEYYTDASPDAISVSIIYIEDSEEDNTAENMAPRALSSNEDSTVESVQQSLENIVIADFTIIHDADQQLVSLSTKVSNLIYKDTYTSTSTYYLKFQVGGLSYMVPIESYCNSPQSILE